MIFLTFCLRNPRAAPIGTAPREPMGAAGALTIVVVVVDRGRRRIVGVVGGRACGFRHVRSGIARVIYLWISQRVWQSADRKSGSECVSADGEKGGEKVGGDNKGSPFFSFFSSYFFFVDVDNGFSITSSRPLFLSPQSSRRLRVLQGDRAPDSHSLPTRQRSNKSPSRSAGSSP